VARCTPGWRSTTRCSSSSPTCRRSVRGGDEHGSAAAGGRRPWQADGHAKEIIDVRGRLDQIIAKHTGQPLDKVAKDTERDYFMSAEEAKAYSIVDRVIEHH
jgi:ATP-dependent protease ClpP protease subunit